LLCNLEKGLEELWVEIGTRAKRKLLDCGFSRKTCSSWGVCREVIKSLSDTDNTSENRNFGARETMRIATPIPPLMVVGDDILDVFW
jgi:hypothetical protein